MNIISIDLEMNKPSNKIIQLGYIIANVKNGKIVCEKRIYINPNEQISEEIQRLTNIYQHQVDIGVTLSEAYDLMVNDITKFQTSKHPLQWGLDHYELRGQLDLDWNDYIFSRRAIDVKAIYQAYAMTRPQGKTVAGLGKALDVLGLRFKGNQHDALDDALNTYYVFKAITEKMLIADRITKALTNPSN